jgi:glyoxylate reductase
MRPKVLITRRLPDPVMEEMHRRFEVALPKRDKPLSYRELHTLIRGRDGLVSMLSDRVDRDLIRCADRLRIVANYAVGYNNIDLQAAAERGIVVTNTPGVLTEATADLAWALILSVSRRIVEADRYVRTGQWDGWAPTQFLGTDVCGRTLGIVGMGRIGQAAARRAIGFGMRVVYWSRTRLPASTEGELSAAFLPLDELLTVSDILSLHLPLTKETHHLLNVERLSRMKPSAILINTSRGPVVDEKALVAALKKKRLAGVGLDVYEREPAVPKDLLRLRQTVVLPHIGSGTIETRTRMGRMVIENLAAAFEDRPAPNRVQT